MKKWFTVFSVLLMTLSMIFTAGCINLGGNKTENVSNNLNNPINTPNGGKTPSSIPQNIGSVSPIAIQNNAFNPAQIQVDAGTTIQWTNNDATVHHLVGPGFDSGELTQGAKFTQNFATPGTYNYICLDIPSAKGMIIVR